ncbi:hypothetical protein [Amycolatopsis sp. NPDC003676]
MALPARLWRGAAALVFRDGHVVEQGEVSRAVADVWLTVPVAV